MKTNNYEIKQIQEIKKWKSIEPGVVSKALGKVLTPLTWVFHKVVPEAAIRGALKASNALAQFFTDSNDIMRDGGVSDIKELNSKDLKLCDKLADEVHNWGIGLATAEGTGTGCLGFWGLAADVPAIITLALRTIYKIGLCYGYEATTQQDKDFVLGIMSAAGANSMKEKITALRFLTTIEVTIAKTTWKVMAQKAAESRLSIEAGIIALRNLGKQLGVNFTKRKAAQAIPVIGAFVGGSANGWFISEVGWAARRAFQERWLLDNGKVIDI